MEAVKTLWHGVDNARVGYLVQWPAEFEQQFQVFRAARDEAQRNPETDGPTTIRLGSYPQEFVVRPIGARMLAFGFDAMGMTVFIGETLSPWVSRDAVTPNVRVEFQPLSVACYGLERVHAEAIRLIEALGGSVCGHQLSEVHVTADMETDRSHRASDYHTSIDGLWRKVRTRMRTHAQVHSVDAPGEVDFRVETVGSKLKQVSVGKDKKMLRIYDKMLELRIHPDKLFEALLWNSPAHSDYLCDCRITTSPETAVMRVEYQLRRERLIERCISTVEEFQEKRGGLWQHLTEEFVTLIEEDDVNRSRCSTQAWWKVVQQAWKECPVMPLPKRPKQLTDIKKYVDQTMGLMLSMGARIDTPPEGLSMEDIMLAMKTYWETTHAERWREVMAKKKKKLDILWAALPEPKQSGSPYVRLVAPRGSLPQAG
jgi:hypothetical protein